MNETSSPASHSSTTIRFAALPNRRSPKKSESAASSSASSVGRITPLPAARPSAFSTTGKPKRRAAARADASSWAISKAAVGIPCRAMNSLAKTLLPSISAAAWRGPKTGTPRISSSSAIPSASGSSGPTTARSMRTEAAKSAISSTSSTERGTRSAISAIPGLPGAQ